MTEYHIVLSYRVSFDRVSFDRVNGLMYQKCLWYKVSDSVNNVQWEYYWGVYTRVFDT